VGENGHERRSIRSDHRKASPGVLQGSPVGHGVLVGVAVGEVPANGAQDVEPRGEGLPGPVTTLLGNLPRRAWLRLPTGGRAPVRRP